MIDFETGPTEPNPTWSYRTPPVFGEVRRGVLYTALEPETLLAFFDGGPVKLLEIRAAIGPRLFLDRDDAPFLPYDDTIIDQNEGVAIHQRAWPWNVGDEVWAFGAWDEQPVFLRFVPEECELFVGRPADFHAFRHWLKDWIDRRTGSRAEVIPRSLFERWDRASASPPAS